MHVLLTGNDDQVIRSQGALDLDLITNQVANIYAASEDALASAVVNVEQGKATEISNDSHGRNRKRVDHYGIVNAGFAYHSSAQNVRGVGNGYLGCERARNGIS